MVKFKIQDLITIQKDTSPCAVHGTVRTVVWEDGGGDPASYPIVGSAVGSCGSGDPFFDLEKKPSGDGWLLSYQRGVVEVWSLQRSRAPSVLK